MSEKRTVAPWVQRMMAEDMELCERIAKLQAFFDSGSPGANARQQDLLFAQLGAMNLYSGILSRRISEALTQ